MQLPIERSAVNNSSVTCPAALTDGHAKEGVLCYLYVSNTINIITYTDVGHDWRGWGGMGVLRDCWGEWGLEGEMGRYSLRA